ncbi:DUF1499 domain-containing protein [Limisalsivibrio acetivorans]|uniref:DUF1499 domain-containing protein n=1 Tax=Limisalsivibrio acetivorans TaxID=1304888 RepID=UPI000416B738|nr:DUF1499 domain-containing protein [Limisalsivibrio acetivorans]
MKYFTASILLSAVLMGGCSSVSYSVKDGLPKCDSRPLCVSSADERDKFYVEPLPVKESVESSLKELAGIIDALPRTEVTKLTENELRALAKSRFFKYKDDIIIIPMNGALGYFSKARIGYYDFGVNRKRYEEIRRLYLD